MHRKNFKSLRDCSLHISQSQNFLRRSPISCATDSSRPIEKAQRESEFLIEFDDSLGCLIRKDYRPSVTDEQFRGADLFLPGESFLGIVRELDIVWRISINKVTRSKRHGVEI